MARDRLAAMRAQQGGQGAYPEQSYPSQVNYGDGGRGYAGGGGDAYGGGRQQQSYNQGYEMDSYGNGAAADDMTAFYSEISAIQDQIRVFNDNVARISDLHSKSLNATDETTMQRNEAQLDGLVEETRALSGNLKKRIQDLHKISGSERDRAIRTQQCGLVNQKFKDAVQSYLDVEKQYRTKYKVRMERQYKIVKPDATPEEIKAAVNDEQGGQVFAQALMQSNRYGDATAAYREVQERHRDIQKIERSITELAQLFQDMSTLVLQQDETINVIQAHAEQVHKDTEAGLQHTEAAVVSARAARKKRWICFFIILIILIIIGVAVGVTIAKNNANK